MLKLLTIGPVSNNEDLGDSVDHLNYKYKNKTTYRTDALTRRSDASFR